MTGKLLVFLPPNLLVCPKSSRNIEKKKCKEKHTKAHYKPFLKTNDKKKIENSAREKGYIIYTGTKVRMETDFSSKRFQERSQWNNIF